MPDLLDEEYLGYGLSAAFGAIAVLTQHNHWLRSPEQCGPITEPLARILARLPAASKRKLMETIDPAALVVGVLQVAGPSVAVEAQYIAAKAQGRVGPKRQPPTAAPAPRTVPDPAKVVDATGMFIQ